jgi:hypothetical protein
MDRRCSNSRFKQVKNINAPSTGSISVFDGSPGDNANYAENTQHSFLRFLRHLRANKTESISVLV